MGPISRYHPLINKEAEALRGKSLAQRKSLIPHEMAGRELNHASGALAVKHRTFSFFPRSSSDFAGPQPPPRGPPARNTFLSSFCDCALPGLPSTSLISPSALECMCLPWLSPGARHSSPLSLPGHPSYRADPLASALTPHLLLQSLTVGEFIYAKCYLGSCFGLRPAWVLARTVLPSHLRPSGPPSKALGGGSAGSSP